MSNLIFKSTDIFQTNCEAIVCPVNCNGVMGAGLAKAFRDKFNNEFYKEQCLKGAMAPGAVIVRKSSALAKDTTKTLIYLATKMDWRDDSKMEWIETGLINLIKAIHYHGIASVAVPALGTGKGNLPWPSVQLIMKTVFENDGLSKLVEVYQPLES